MVRPAVSDWTEQLYDRLPEVYRVLDAPADYPLLRYLQLIGDTSGGPLLALINRLDPSTNGGVSALLDAATADLAWLPWLASIRGVRLAAGMTEAQQRQAIITGGAYQAGTVPSMQAAAAPYLTGTKTLRVIPGSVTLPGDGQWYDLLVVTRPEETPDSSKILPALEAAGVRPAGCVFHYGQLIASYAHLRDVHGSYSTLRATFPTYGQMTAHTPE